jgi:hypothetical protein
VKRPLNSYDWPDAGGADALEETLRTTTPDERLAWLDDMLDLAYVSGALDRARALEEAERAT